MSTIATYQLGSIATLKQQLTDLLKHNANKIDQAEIRMNQGAGFSVTARKGEAESVEHSRGGEASLTVYINQRTGSASTTDLSTHSIQAAFDKAISIARFAGQDDCAGLADGDTMAYDYPQLDMCHPWEITPEKAIEMAIECETKALAEDKRIIHSDGVTVQTYQNQQVYANTHGFIGDYRKTYHAINCTLVAEEQGQMQTEGDYTCARNATDLAIVDQVALSAAKRTVDRLGATRLTTRKCPVVFSPEMSRGLWSSFLSAISGVALYKKTTFLLDHLGKAILPSHINLSENPYLANGMGSTPFDAEGACVYQRDIVAQGVLSSYLLGSYSARRLGMKSTGNAGGAHNVLVSAGEKSAHALLKQMGTGLLVTQLLGQGVNVLTGDYSRGAFGYWVENGEIQYPVHEITIAGNLKDMFANIVEVGNDTDNRGNIQVGSVLIDSMTIAGK
jgi:PmbA protein